MSHRSIIKRVSVLIHKTYFTILIYFCHQLNSSYFFVFIKNYVGTLVFSPVS
ncbi:unnamed protein product [Spodoptera exigua]|nr:unnamed protein product [Spodoptera exigua]